MHSIYVNVNILNLLVLYWKNGEFINFIQMNRNRNDPFLKVESTTIFTACFLLCTIANENNVMVLCQNNEVKIV